jgi:hypothetical protein
MYVAFSIKLLLVPAKTVTAVMETALEVMFKIVAMLFLNEVWNAA